MSVGAGGTMTGALNAANEMANEMFREGQLDYLDIPRMVAQARRPASNDPSKTLRWVWRVGVD